MQVTCKHIGVVKRTVLWNRTAAMGL